ncbi:MAG: glycosyltransferase family 4 protein [Candidatus Marinimicrobia bacterium]|nr:glycosyltransferase family 4 protein [Candidatus Neomarinimicrobiota bacterium]MBT3618522.1 glycosyltransferase family 4 protein [Candidatus Neomarinimicrobiota bacterium]MBT3828928.1 glycosyltransferase family 4 protein [Candidatus Neomarinimicrobiota bacterium]MBT3997312.1 glycosyltransferase family 4 protein [Candidatus Neomarinimicrobiota bacterium]MBT4281166.1 glycosyltransferase family 4 protein [Candidatus Neomarinimicrobiota bacterium]
MKIIFSANTSWYLYNFRKKLIESMVSRGWDVILVAPQDAYYWKIKMPGIKYIGLPIDRYGFSPLHAWATVKSYYKIFKREKPDVIHLFTIKPVILGTIAARLAGIPKIVNSITGLGYIFTSGSRLRKIVETVYRSVLTSSRVDVILQNPDDEKLFQSFSRIQTTKIHLIRGSGVDLESFLLDGLKPPSELDNHSIHFIMFCRMLWDKGVQEFVSAAELVKTHIPNARFHLIGGIETGSPNEVPKSWLVQFQTHDFIHWVNHVEDIRPWIAGSHVVVLPTYYGEGVPKSLIEAAALTKPIITTNIAGCREIVIDHYNGLLIPPNSVEALVKAMIHLGQDQILREKMGKQGRTLVEKEFGDGPVITSTSAVYGIDC